MTRTPKWGRGYAMVPGWMLRKKPSPNALTVYVHLAMHGTFNPGDGTYEQCRPSKKTLANGDPSRGYPGCGLGEQVVARALRELEKIGAIKGEPYYHPITGAQGATVYRLVFGEITEEEDAASQEEIPAQRGASPLTPPTQTTTPHIAGDMGGVSPATPPGAHSDTPPRVSPVIHNQEPLTQNPKNKKTPPTPRPRRQRAAAPESNAEKRGEPETSPEEQRQAAFVAEISDLAGWDPVTTRKVLDELRSRPRAKDGEIARVLRETASGKHGVTASPRRLLVWWPSGMAESSGPSDPYRHEHLPRDVVRCSVHPDRAADGCPLEHPRPKRTPAEAAAAAAEARAAVAAARAQLPRGKAGVFGKRPPADAPRASDPAQTEVA